GARWQCQRVIEPVDHQSRQAVAFGMTQPVEGLVVDRLAQGQGAAQALREESGIDDRIAFRRQQADRDQAFGIEVTRSEGSPIFAPHIDHAARHQRLGGRVHADLIGEDPGRAVAGLGPLPLRHNDGFARHKARCLAPPCTAVHAVLRCAEPAWENSMAVDGKWEIVINSPLGAQKAVLDMATDGNSLSGTQTAQQGSGPLENGKVDGNNLTWSAKITNPMPLTL